MQKMTKKEPFFSVSGVLKNRKQISYFFEKKIIIKKCAYGLKMKPHQVLHEYFEVYGQAD